MCRKSKTKSGDSGYEKLTIWDLEFVAPTLIKYSNECDDEYFNVQVGQLSISDVLAKEFKYHRSCYRTITRPSLTKDPNKCLGRDLWEKCFSELKEYIDEKILMNVEFVRMFYLSDYYGELQEKKGIEKKAPWSETWKPDSSILMEMV